MRERQQLAPRAHIDTSDDGSSAIEKKFTRSVDQAAWSMRR